jgi:hypothetical protein
MCLDMGSNPVRRGGKPATNNWAMARPDPETATAQHEPSDYTRAPYLASHSRCGSAHRSVAYCANPWWQMRHEALTKWWLARKKECPEKSPSQCQSVHHKSDARPNQACTTRSPRATLPFSWILSTVKILPLIVWTYCLHLQVKVATTQELCACASATSRSEVFLSLSRESEGSLSASSGPRSSRRSYHGNAWFTHNRVSAAVCDRYAHSRQIRLMDSRSRAYWRRHFQTSCPMFRLPSLNNFCGFLQSFQQWKTSRPAPSKS